jgi:membrane protein DedA with SNARE-associated domain
MNRKRVFIIAVLLLLVCQPLMAQEGAGVAEAVRGDSASTGWVAWVLHKYDKHMNYWTVGGLMAIESSFIPFPSEVVIPPAVYVALDEHSQSGMNWWLVVIFGTLGALVGAFINYFLSRWLGRPIIYAFVDSKLGHILQLSGEKMERAEKYFNDHGVFSTLVGRLIPVVRQLISIPAGLSKMNIGTFALYTTLGALIWNCVLALLGYLAHLAGDISVVEKYSSEISYIIIGLVILVALILTVRYFIKKNRKK